MRLFINHRQDNWVDWISLAEFSYNNKIHSATQMTPFYASHGYNPRMGFEPRTTFKSESAEEFGNRIKKIHEEAQSALVRSREEMKRYCYVRSVLRTHSSHHMPTFLSLTHFDSSLSMTHLTRSYTYCHVNVQPSTG